MAKKSLAAMPADDYQAQDDMHTLMRAHEIKRDPKRHAAAKAHAKTKLAAMQQVMEVPDGDEGKTAPKVKAAAKPRAPKK